MGQGREVLMSTRERIDQLVKGNDVVLFMKGNKFFPQCGFSARAVGILQHAGVTKFETVDVLADPEIREGVKQYSSWPTIPQLYIRGEFIGGSDIMMELYESGELQKKLQGA
jgi:monothiol glutaredoxin